MFLIRTVTSARGTSCANAALAHVQEMRQAGQSVVITNLGGRNLSTADLRRTIRAAPTALQARS